MLTWPLGLFSPFFFCLALQTKHLSPTTHLAAQRVLLLEAVFAFAELFFFFFLRSAIARRLFFHQTSAQHPQQKLHSHEYTPHLLNTTGSPM
jgi:hypothetical protein